MEYMVLYIEDSGADSLERSLNRHAADGWRPVSVMFRGLVENADGGLYTVVFEREKK